MVAAAAFQHRALDHAGLGEHQRDCARFVAGSGLFRLGQPAPGGAACVEQRLPTGLRCDLAQPGCVDTLLPEVVEGNLVRVRREPGARFLHRVAVGNAVEFHAISGVRGGSAARGRKIGKNKDTILPDLMHYAVHSHTAPPPPGDPSLRSLGRLFPYLWEFRARVLLALILGYGVLRFASTTFADLRDVIFAKVTQRAMRRISMAVFKHLHALSLRFHLERQTGGITRDIERGARALSSLVGYLLFRITPTVLEILMVAGILFVKLDWVFGVLTLVTLAAYIGFTVTITEWRTQFVRRANTLDSEAYGRAIDSLLNYETVKYFGNEKYEAERYEKSLVEWEDMALKSQRSLGMLDAAQAGVIAIGGPLTVLRAAHGVVAGTLTLGDLVMVNAFLLQMFQPLSFLGVMYREIKQSITDVERMFTLLHRPQEVQDAKDARTLDVVAGEVKFDHVSFAYNPDRPILHDVSFTI